MGPRCHPITVASWLGDQTADRAVTATVPRLIDARWHLWQRALARGPQAIERAAYPRLKSRSMRRRRGAGVAAAAGPGLLPASLDVAP